MPAAENKLAYIHEAIERCLPEDEAQRFRSLFLSDLTVVYFKEGQDPSNNVVFDTTNFKLLVNKNIPLARKLQGKSPEEMLAIV